MYPYPSLLAAQGINGAVPSWTWNPADKDAGAALSNSNRTLTVASSEVAARGTVSNGSATAKYTEFVIQVAGAGIAIGCSSASETTAGAVGATAFGTGYRSNGNVVHNGSVIATLATYAVGDIIGISFLPDTVNGLWVFKNGISLNGNPAALTGGYPTTNASLFAAASAASGGQVAIPSFLTYGPPTGAGVL